MVGEFKEIATSVPGMRFSEHLPQLAKQADQLAIIRGLSTKEGDHGRGTHLMRTGHAPMGVEKFPAIGASLAKQLASTEVSLPPYVSIAPYRAFNADVIWARLLGTQVCPAVRGRDQQRRPRSRR